MSFAAGWYAVGLSAGLEPGTSAGTRLFDQELVVWRDEHGASHVWEDRCPHRGMRLSFGFVRGNHIACLYHGWQYDAAGRCRHIPAHPKLDVPETIRVQTYPSIEAIGMIWAHCGGEPDTAPDDADVVPVRSLYVDSWPETVAARLDAAGIGLVGPSLRAATVEGGTVLLALQPFTAERTALHLVIVGGGTTAKAAALWAEDLRDSLEAGPEAA